MTHDVSRLSLLLEVVKGHVDKTFQDPKTFCPLLVLTVTLSSTVHAISRRFTTRSIWPKFWILTLVCFKTVQDFLRPWPFCKI
jgi:hypothetical protein